MIHYLFKDNKKSMVYISDKPKTGYRKIITSYKVLNSNKKDAPKTKESEMWEFAKTQEMREIYKNWKEAHVLIKDPSPSYYIYEQEYEFEGKTYIRTGFIGIMKLEELGTIKKVIVTKELVSDKLDDIVDNVDTARYIL